MFVDQPLGLQRAVLHRIGAGNAERIETMKIASGRQNSRRTQEIAARRRTHELAVERMQDAGYLVILRQQDIRRRKLRVEGKVRFTAGRATRSGQSLGRVTA